MPSVVSVKTRYAPFDQWFNPSGIVIVKGDHVIIETERGTEIGMATSAPFDVPKEEIENPLTHVIRVASESDLEHAEELSDKGDEALPVFREFSEREKLEMKPVAVEYLFGGERIVFYFAAEDRVDFRNLVRDLAKHFHQRVDMRQIGVRDEARMRGGFAHCGQELCCVRLGGEFKPVSIRMAKEQDLPLNSSKISGACGRLMCCLRYEFEAYKDFKSRAPKNNTIIDTPLGKAKIVEYDTPRERLRLRLEDGKSFTVPLGEMTCSDNARSKVANTGRLPRPDTVNMETLQMIEAPEIIAALSAMDRRRELAELERNGGLEDSIAETRHARKPRANQNEPRRESEPSSKNDNSANTRNRRRKPKTSNADTADKNSSTSSVKASGTENKKNRASNSSDKNKGGSPRRSSSKPVDKTGAGAEASKDKKSTNTRTRRPRTRNNSKPATQAPQGQEKQSTNTNKPATKKSGTAKQETRTRRPATSANKPNASRDKPAGETRRRRRPGDGGGQK